MKSIIRWLKIDSSIVANASSLIGSTAITSGLGFIYWWLAARQFSPTIVGLSSATISAMTLLGTFSMLGLGTFLMGELSRQRSQAASLISAALIIAGGVGGCLGLIFTMIAPYISRDFQVLRASIGNIAIFTVGVSLAAITLVLDQALLGLLRGDLQLKRNALFAFVKLVALFVVGLWFVQTTNLIIYATWAFGNLLSLLALAVFAVLKGQWSGRIYLPRWRLLKTLGPEALKHHLLNLMLQAPSNLLPILVTIVLSAAANAWFYVSWTMASFANVATAALTTTLYAVSSVQPSTLARKIRLTLGLALVSTALANCLYQFGTEQILGFFGHTYAQQASWSLRILGLESFPFIIKAHYVAISRIQGRVAKASLVTIFGGILELSASVLGGYFGGLSGLSFGWFLALCIEALIMSRTVYRAVVSKDTSLEIPVEHDSVETEAIWLIDTFVMVSVKDPYLQAKIDTSKERTSLNGTNRHNRRSKLKPIRLYGYVTSDENTSTDEKVEKIC